MALDVERIEPEEALKLLGDGDWHIKNDDENHPELVFNLQFRQTILDYAANLFVRWVIAGREVKIYHHNDPSWDSSGSARTHIVDPLILLVKYETMNDWMENASTGHSKASYVSGMGLFWITFGEEIKDFVQESIYNLVKANLEAIYHIPEDEEAWEHDKWEDWEFVSWWVEPICMLWLSQFSTKDIWAKYEISVRTKIAEERIIYEKRQKIMERQRQLADNFWKAHFPELVGQRLEAPEFDARGIAEHLKVVFPYTAPEVVEAIASVGVTGNFSNSIRYAIKHIAEQACE